MGGLLEFGDETALRLEAMYTSADVQRRRQIATAALHLAGGESVLDVGCGPGFHIAELADLVGDDGRVTGIDPSAAMLAAAASRNEHRGNVALLPGQATGLPVPDASYDAAVAVQVLEYVNDVAGALSEMHRVLKEGGRLVVWDIDWSTVSWQSSSPETMTSVLDAWDLHLVDPVLPRTLAASMRSAGFGDVRVEGHAFVNTDSGPDGYSGNLIPLIEDFVTSNGITSENAAVWRSDLLDLSDGGHYFFAVTQFCLSATRPA